jgi:hypothetical protein
MPIDPKRTGGIRHYILHKDIEYAQAQTHSHAEAARYLHVSFSTYKKWARLYGLYDTAHKNSAGRGVSKKRTKGIFGLDAILAGQHPNYDRNKLKERLIRAHYLPGECAFCGYTKTRPDGRGPFVLGYIDGNTANLQLDNLRLLCYNCTYLTTGVAEIGPNTPAPQAGTTDRDQLDLLGSDELDALRDEFIDQQRVADD